MRGRILKAIRPSGPIVRAQVMTAAERAARILEECEAECAERRNAAWREGWAAGFEEWQAALESARKAADGYRASVEPELGRLAVRIASKIIGDVVQVDPVRVVHVTREALRGVSREKRVTIRVAPGMGALIESNLDLLRERLAPDCQVRVVESAEVEPGGCLLVSELGVIDARIETQLAHVKRALTGGAR
jgi:flagellar biosynthesis/type III secretory pathway protein FliH